MGKDSRKHGRRVRAGELLKRAKRRKARRDAWKITDGGAGARSIEDPQRHHR